MGVPPMLHGRDARATLLQLHFPGLMVCFVQVHHGRSSTGAGNM